MEKAITMSAAAKGKQIVQQQCEESTLTTAVTTDTENKVLAFLSSISCKATDKNYVGKDEQMEKHEDSVNGVIDDVLNLILASHTTERRVEPLSPNMVILHQMICRFLDQKMDEIEVHYSELSRAKTSQLAQEKCNLRELIVEQKCDIKELEQRNKQLEAKLIDTKRQINRLNHKRQRDCNRHEQEKKVIKEMVTDMKIRVSEAMDECIERTRRESAEKIQALEKALEKALGEAKITDNDD